MDLLLPWCLQDVRIWDVRSFFKVVFSTCILAYSTDEARSLVISPGALSLSLSMLLGIPGGVRLISLLPLLNGTFLRGIFSFLGHVELFVLFSYTNKCYHQIPKADALFCGFRFDPRSQSLL